MVAAVSAAFQNSAGDTPIRLSLRAGSATANYSLVLPYGVPPGLGVGDGLLNAGCGLTAGEEPHPVKALPAF